MIHVFLLITALPGKKQAMLDEINSKLGIIRSEEGCIEFTVATDSSAAVQMFDPTQIGPDTIAILEKWASVADLEAHSTQPYVPEHFAIVKSMMASRVAYFLESVA